MAKAKRARKAKPNRKPQFKPFRLSVRITEEMKNQIDAARAENGRTFSGEIEFQLQRALFDWGTGPTHAVMVAVGKAVDSVAKMQVGVSEGWSKDAQARWWADPYLFNQAAQAMSTALEMFKPQGAPPQGEELYDVGGPRQGRFAVESILRDVQLVDASKAPGEQTPYERWLCWLRTDLGFLADHPTVWGRSARQVQHVKAGGADFRDELIALSKEGGRKPDDMSMEEYQNPDQDPDVFRQALEKRNLTPEKRKRLNELRRKIAELREETEL